MIETTELPAAFAALKGKLGGLEAALDLPALQVRIGEIEKKMEAPGFWNAPEAAQGRIEELKRLKAKATPLLEAARSLRDLEELFHLGESEGDESTLREVAQDLEGLAGAVD
ncbi:MAG: hypothetical protein V1918_04620, partial [Planctomycetota bacterium]